MKNREFKGQLKGFPVEVVEKMLERQEEQGNTRDVNVFENSNIADRKRMGFTWIDTIEGYNFWRKIIEYENFDMFFERYPNKNKKLKKFKKYLKSKGYQLDTEAGLNEYVTDHTWKDLYELFNEYFKTENGTVFDNKKIKKSIMENKLVKKWHVIVKYENDKIVEYLIDVDSSLTDTEEIMDYIASSLSIMELNEDILWFIVNGKVEVELKDI